MARDVATTLKKLVAIKLNLNEEQVEDYFFQLKVWELGWDAPEGSDQGHMPVEPGPEQQTLGVGEGSVLRPSAPLQKPGAAWAPGAWSFLAAVVAS